MHSIGCDLHSKRTWFCLVDGRPEAVGYPLPPQAILLEREVPTERRAIAEFLAEADQVAPGPKALAVETVGNWYWFLDFVEPLLEEVHLVNAGKAKAIASARIKTDKLDARVLAWLLRNQLIPEVYIPPKAARDLREAYRHRTYLVRMQTRFKNRIHSILLKLGLRRVHSDLFGPGGREYLARLEIDPSYRLVLDHSLGLIEELGKRTLQTEAHLAHHPVRPDRAIRILDSLPGFGLLLATHASLEILDIERFPGDKNYVSYCGLAPGTHHSQDTVKRQGLLPHGNRWLKWVYLLGAQHAANHPYFRKTYQRQLALNGAMTARISLARRMAISSYHMLTKGEFFNGGA